MTVKIHDDKVATEIYNHVMDIPITITQHELLSLALELCAKVVDATLKWAHPPKPNQVAQVMLKEIEDLDTSNTEEVGWSKPKRGMSVGVEHSLCVNGPGGTALISSLCHHLYPPGFEKPGSFSVIKTI